MLYKTYSLHYVDIWSRKGANWLYCFFSSIGSWVKFFSLWVTIRHKGGLRISSISSVRSQLRDRSISCWTVLFKVHTCSLHNVVTFASNGKQCSTMLHLAPLNISCFPASSPPHLYFHRSHSRCDWFTLQSPILLKRTTRAMQVDCKQYRHFWSVLY
jgi:hypothetical protein